MKVLPALSAASYIFYTKKYVLSPFLLVLKDKIPESIAPKKQNPPL
jgi:hypothetical protein